MNVTEIVDAASEDRVVVFGSLPPHGRDLDLVLRGADCTRVEAALRAKGFIGNERRLARFRLDGVDAVEVVDVDRWRLGPSESAALLDDSIVLDGHRHLSRPAPHHAVLLLARRVADGGAVDGKRRQRLEDAVAENPDAFRAARSRARAWRVERALALLEEQWRAGALPSRAERALALAELRGSARAVTSLLPRGRRGAVVAFSGLDGSGKSSQVEALCERLLALGFEPVREWTRLSYNPRLFAVVDPIKRLVLPLAARARARRPSPPPSSSLDPSRLRDPVKQLRQGSPALNWTWALIITVANVTAQRRSTKRHLRAGRIVVCDRYTLDSIVHLRYRYGERFATHVRLLTALSPRPIVAFLVDVDPAVAHQRKAEEYGLPQLTRQADLYHEELAELGVIRLDGERPVHDLAREVAGAVFTRLADR